MQLGYQHHRLFMALAAVIILFIGIGLGDYLIKNLTIIDIEAVRIGLAFTTIVLLLIIGSLILEVKAALGSKKKGK